ncbi:ABC transporter ATP-binding protein [Natrarchaeobius sp. A-rgal3]|uniref:ABC transporter ATP-binding protein n=1 Tax=Natrarchaeobius versutus TaxID=1679078 RepID=UPI00350F791A
MSDPTIEDEERTKQTMLRISNLEKRFGGIVAVDGASFEVERETITGLIGPNGAGKSTVFNLITGVYEPDAGQIYLEGEDVTELRPHQLVDRGLVRTFQISRELAGMTVLENMLLAFDGQLGESLWRSLVPGARRSVVHQERELLDRTWEILELFELDHLAHEDAANLSGGQRKLLELSRALLTDPELLLLDEPMAGVNPTLEKKLLARLHELRSQGYTFLIVEHDMDVIMNNCERVIVMHQGQVLSHGPPEVIQEDERVIDAYLGGQI